MAVSEKTASWDVFSWCCLLTWRQEKPSHDAVFLLEDMKSHLMILSYYLKIMRWLFRSSSKKTESWDGFSCLQVRRQNHEMAFNVVKYMKSHLMILSSYLKTWKTISWCCLLTWRHLMMLSSHLQPSHDAVFLLEDIKSDLMILSSYLKAWKTGFSCLQVRRQNHEMAFNVFK
jgi:hypothetical protein